MPTFAVVLTVAGSILAGWIAAKVQASSALHRMREQMDTHLRQRLIDRKADQFESVMEEVASLIVLVLKGYDQDGSVEWQQLLANQLESLSRAAYRTLTTGSDAIANEVSAFSRIIAQAVQEWDAGHPPSKDSLVKTLSEQVSHLSVLMAMELPLHGADTKKVVLNLK